MLLATGMTLGIIAASPQNNSLSSPWWGEVAIGIGVVGGTERTLVIFRNARLANKYKAEQPSMPFSSYVQKEILNTLLSTHENLPERPKMAQHLTELTSSPTTVFTPLFAFLSSSEFTSIYNGTLAYDNPYKAAAYVTIPLLLTVGGTALNEWSAIILRRDFMQQLGITMEDHSLD